MISLCEYLLQLPGRRAGSWSDSRREQMMSWILGLAGRTGHLKYSYLSSGGICRVGAVC